MESFHNPVNVVGLSARFASRQIQQVARELGYARQLRLLPFSKFLIRKVCRQVPAPVSSSTARAEQFRGAPSMWSANNFS